MERETLLDLRRLGLSASEARVYAAVLETGGGLVSSISRRAGVPRTNCYYTLKTLAEKGLISITSKGKLRFFLPESPRQIVVEQRRKLSVAETLLPSLLALERAPATQAPKMKYYEGYQGMCTVLNESLSAQTEILTYTNVALLLEKFPELLREHCTRRAARNVRTRIISPYHESTEHFLEEYFPPDYIAASVQLLYVNAREFMLTSEVSIFDDKVCVITLSPEENLAVVIESRAYAESSRAAFNLAWLGATSFVAQ